MEADAQQVSGVWKASAMTWTLPEPILTAPVPGPDLPPGSAAEPKRDGYRAQLARYADGRVLLCSRQGTDMTAAFPEIRWVALRSEYQAPPNRSNDKLIP
uniref:Putative ATP-dependent DNA ligase n=2 Tax=Streptomyces ambofaciens (strain ATCC 23877 / 3486 / DSM 40053 / JCM 4204 / NBRC 12836 / NRRL B-2516) TaxID=278992 RepID=Q1RRF1_STRA7|nr:putative ATP-dependent DNA ligase [Streptomyces ambofaciens ATCC 23877]CAJ89195.1 putative ATP-dependent DNA ligase [Streptomyces ambofaciens ATCC 23877]